MRLQTFKKTPDEIKRYGVDYTKWLDVNERIKSISLSVGGADTTLTAANGTITTDGQKIVFFVSGGTVGNVYNVYIEITTSGAQLREDTMPFVVVAP